MVDEGWQLFLNICSELQKSQELDAFLTFLLTLEEKEDIAKRVLIVKELLSGDVTQRELSSKLGVSFSKITRGSNALKQCSPDFKLLLTNLTQKELGKEN